jgi:chromosome segregation ATPase
VIKIRKDMYDLRAMMVAQERNAQVKDLSLSTMQIKVMDDKVKGYQDRINLLLAANDKQAQEMGSLKTDLALARQELKGMPSSDEIEFLRAGLKKATLELKQKDDALLQTKANADEYEKEYKQQSMDFQSLKTQLQDAYDDLNRRNEDLKYKNLEIIRLKERAAIKEGDLEDQIKALTQKLEGIKQGSLGVIHGNKVEVLEAQLMSANAQVKDLRKQLDEFILPSKKDPLREKLKQALDKINELGRVVTVLSQKLQECGQSANVTRQ